MPYLHAILFHASAGFEVGADALAGAFLEFWELSAAGLDDGLDFLLGLLGDGNHPIQVLIHKQTHKHLQEKNTLGFFLSNMAAEASLIKWRCHRRVEHHRMLHEARKSSD